MRKDLRTYGVYSLLPMLGLVLGCAFAWDFVLGALKQNVALNLKIVIALLFGAVLAYRLIWKMSREDRGLRDFLQVAKEVQSVEPEVATSRFARVLSGERFLKLDVTKVLGPVVKTGGRVASRVEQAAIDQEFQAMRATLDSRMELPNFIPGLCIALGLLGTFIGLLNTLSGTAALIEGLGADGNLDKAVGTLVRGLGAPLQGMGTAFSASMFGLLASVVLGLVMVAVRSYATVLMSNVKHAIERVVSIAPNVVTQGTGNLTGVGIGIGGASEAYMTETLSEVLVAQREALEAFRRTMNEVAQSAQRSESVMGKVDQLTAALRQQIQALQHQNELVGVGPRMREMAEQSLLETRRMCEATVSHGRELEKIAQGFGDLDRRLSGHVEAAARERQAIREAMSASLESQNAMRSMVSATWEQDRAGRLALVHAMHSLRQSNADTQAAMVGWGTRLGHLQELASDQVVQTERHSNELRQLVNSVDQLSRQLIDSAEKAHVESVSGRQAQVEVAKQLSGVATVLRLTNETLAERIAAVVDATGSYTTSAALMTQEIAVFKSGVSKELRKEVREALIQSGLAQHASSPTTRS